MALTATATLQVRADIDNQLKLNANRKCFLSSLNRPNLQYMIKQKTSSKATKQEIKTFIQDNFPEATGIIYCLSRGECDQLAESLKTVKKLLR